MSVSSHYDVSAASCADQYDPEKLYRQAQLDLKGDTSWRGMLLCSAGLIEATKDSGV
jgi:hypothetical protein